MNILFLCIISMFILLCGAIMPFLIDIIAQILNSNISFTEAANNPNSVSATYDSETIIINMIPYCLVVLLIIIGESKAGKIFLEIFRYLLAPFFYIIRLLIGRPASNMIRIESDKKKPPHLYHILGIAISFFIVLFLNFYFHYGALHGVYNPTVRPSSTSGLVYVFFPFYSSLAVFIAYGIVVVGKHLRN